MKSRTKLKGNYKRGQTNKRSRNWSLPQLFFRQKIYNNASYFIYMSRHKKGFLYLINPTPLFKVNIKSFT